VRHVWPPGADVVTELDREGLLAHYAYPEGLTRPMVRVNFVASADGAVAVDGVSGGLDAPGDAEVFGTLRELADVVLVGSGTVRAEGYRGVRTSDDKVARRRARGRGDVPPVAVVTTSADLDPAAGLFTDTRVPPLVLTAAAAPAAARERLAAAGAEVVPVSGDDPAATDPATILAALAARGLHRVLCEGGPALFGSLLAAGLVDELCLSVAPQLVGSGPGRIVAGPALDGPRRLSLTSVLAHDHGLMLRYAVDPARM
jgi:riboflavin biosynthesis pyrimidine reductase